jgi:UDP-2,3-diacylglucosamine hydrolase
VKKTLIFSDVHLKVTDGARAHREEFVGFLRGIDPAEFDRIICLGDLFDFWFEYRHVIFSGYFEVLRAFAELRDAGVELHLVCGNHDFWAGRFLRDELGFQIHPSSATLPFGSQRAHFIHGDGINPEDWRYRAYKRVARHPAVIWAFRQLHPDWAMALAQGVSHGSRTFLATPDPFTGPESTSLRAYARGVLERGEADAVFCGHAHAPVQEAYPTPTGIGCYINTGDWLQHRSHVVWDGTEFALVNAPSPAPAVTEGA